MQQCGKTCWGSYCGANAHTGPRPRPEWPVVTIRRRRLDFFIGEATSSASLSLIGRHGDSGRYEVQDLGQVAFDFIKCQFLTLPWRLISKI